MANNITCDSQLQLYICTSLTGWGQTLENKVTLHWDMPPSADVII